MIGCRCFRPLFPVPKHRRPAVFFWGGGTAHGFDADSVCSIRFLKFHCRKDISWGYPYFLQEEEQVLQLEAEQEVMRLGKGMLGAATNASSMTSMETEPHFLSNSLLIQNVKPCTKITSSFSVGLSKINSRRELCSPGAR